ncbi:immunoglobulin-like domain-containing protein [Listeria booriae]|uniref:immunoglobulin-like domain-containing protein n=1 Tax=Listeria booriae TaxID=1552123 RepID=UPI001623C56C|nr:immunoglobulin-like domain-containing protein [Listeria booriae]MBC2195415.1 hypothetical protein [Listeria booriae]
MTKYQTMKKVAMAAIVANVVASSAITAMPGLTKAAENPATDAGTKAQTMLKAGVAATNLLKNTNFDGIANWYLTGQAQVLTLSGPDENGAYFYEADYKRYSIRAWGNGQVSLGSKGDSNIMGQDVATIPGHTYKLQYKAVTTSGTMYYRVQVFGSGPKLAESSNGAVMTGGYRVSDETTQTLTFTANSTTTKFGFGVVGDNHSAGTMRYSNLSLVDVTTIADTTLNALTTQSTTATGTGEPGGTVVIKNAAGTQIGTGTVLPNGTYSVTIPKQAYNTNVTATVTALQIPSAASKTVTQAALANTTINPLTTKSTTASGTGEPGATVTFKAGGKDYTTTVKGDGTWSVVIPKQAKGAAVEATATLNGVSSNKATGTVANGGPTVPTLDNVTNESTKVTGLGDPGNAITVKVTTDGHTISYSGTVGPDGKYSVNIDTPAAGAVVQVVASDGELSSTPVSKTVLDTIAPDAPEVDSVKLNDTTITGKGEPNCDVTVTLPSGGTVAGKTDKDGKFDITIPKQTVVDKEIKVTLTDAAGNVSDPTTVVVKPNTIANPTISAVTTDDTVVKGTGVAGATVTVKANNIEYTGLVSPEGTYSITIPKQAAHSTITASQAKDGVTSETVSTKVIDNRTPSAPVVSPVKDSDTAITGTGTKGDTIQVTTPDGEKHTAVVGDDGKWSVPVPAQEAGAKIDVIAIAPNEKTSSPTEVTVAQTPQTGKITTNDFTVGQDKYIVGTFTGDVKSFRVTIDGKAYTGGSIDTVKGTYTFYALDKATAAGTFKIEGLDKYGNVLDTKTANIVKKSSDNTPGVGTVVADKFVIHQDKSVTGTVTGDVKSIKLVYDGTTYSGGSIVDGKFTFYALDKITDKSKVASIDGYDAKGNKIATSVISLSDANDSGSGIGKGTVTANDFTLSKDSNITGAYTGDVKSIKVRVGDTTYAGGTLTDGNYVFYARDKISSTTQVVFVDGYDAKGNKIATTAVTVKAQGLPVTAGTITPDMFTVATDKTLTASYTGDVKSVVVTINGTKYTGGTVADGKVSFYIGNKIAATDTVTIEAFDAYGRSLQVKNVPVQQNIPVTTGTVTPNTFTTPGDSYLTGTFTGAVKSVIVTINGTDYAGGTVEDGKINFWIGSKISKATDVVTIKGLDAAGKTLDTKTVTIAAAKPEVGTITPADFSFKTSAIKGTYTGNAKSLLVTVNGVALPAGGTVADGNFSYYVGLQNKVAAKTDVVKISLLDKNGLVMDEKTVTIVD